MYKKGKNLHCVTKVTAESVDFGVKSRTNIRKILFKAPKERGKITNPVPGCFVEKKSFEALVEELNKQGKNIFLLDKKGADIRDLKFQGNEIFIIGDQDGFPADKKHILKRIDKISVSPKMLFASQVVTVVHNEVDRQTV